MGLSFFVDDQLANPVKSLQPCKEAAPGKIKPRWCPFYAKGSAGLWSNRCWPVAIIGIPCQRLWRKVEACSTRAFYWGDI